ncbi:hypothetical protein R1sor_009596 [Riccia sorocarpa]|uniref:DUF4100 domain-containing protein n=1 Tax=Riccia sorocarpa TaxID=122646 RepID=A0ABD3HVI0_9MARC
MSGVESSSSSQDRSSEMDKNGARLLGFGDVRADQLLEAFILFLQRQQPHGRREDLATRALHAVVGTLDQFDGRDVSKYLRVYKKEMELNRVSEREMILTFELAAAPEIREHVKKLIGHYGVDWETFSRILKDEYFLEDSDRVTKRSFLEWVERPNKSLLATELLREFERQFSQLSRVERMTLQSDKTELFLRAADPELQEKLELLLEDKEADEGLTTNWKNVEDAVGMIAKRERRREKISVIRFAHTPASIPTIPMRAPVVQPIGPVALKDSGALLQTNFGRGGMKKVVEDYLATHAIAVVEAASYAGTLVGKGSTTDGFVEADERWQSALQSMKKGKTPPEVLLRAATKVRETTGWDDPVQSLSLHAFIASNQHEVLLEEKRRREEEVEGAVTKRQTRLQTQVEKSRRESLPEDVRMTEPSVRPMPKEKGKSPAYKLQSDVETSVNMREVIDKRILNTKIEISLKELMGLAKKEVHDILVDGVKRKRQIAGETANIQTLEGVTLDEEKNYDVANVCNIPAVKPQDLHVRWADEAKDEGELPISHYTVNHWARGTTETLVGVGDLEDPVVALIDHGSEINVMAKSLHEKGKWPIDFEHGWMVRTANNSRGGLHGACPSMDIQIGGIKVEQRVFVQEGASFPIILGQPFITAVRMETKVLDDGSAYARIRSRDNKNTVQFLTVPVNHERNREQLRRIPLPPPTEEFEDF